MKKVFVLLLLLSLFIITPTKTISVECEPGATSDQTDLQQKITACQQKISALKEKSQTLSSQIQYMNSQIYLTALKIQETETKIKTTAEEIEKLTSKIEGLDQSLNYLSKLLIVKIVDGYKKRSLSFLDVFLNTDSAFDFLNGVKYLKSTREKNQQVLVQVQTTKLNFEEQKKLREEKKKQLDDLQKTLAQQKINLDSQKLAKEKLLSDTQNDERVYQGLLAQAQAEYTAILGIIAGQGTETELRNVNKGDSIALVISGKSCNSSGAHLHFMVLQDNATVNPFSFLKQIDYRNCSSYTCGSADSDPFNPSGSLDWPLDPTIELEQGYGNTWAVNNTWVRNIYSFHNGIDINGSSNNVKAVSDGKLFKGVYAVGCPLSYVKLVHNNSNLVTFYLHVYPQ